MEQNYKQCNYCIMDNINDEFIAFDEKGQCSYCRKALATVEKTIAQKDKLDSIIVKMKSECSSDKYDCLMGISGGIDSSYALYQAYRLGLRVLVIHIDDGFDTEISQRNLLKLIERTKYDYQVISPDKDQYAELIKAFMKSGVPNIAAPQDNCLFSELYHIAKLNKIKYFVTGTNMATESIGKVDGHTVYDMVFVKDICKKFGKIKIDKLKMFNDRKIMKYRHSANMKTIQVLDYLEYNVERAFRELKEFCGFEYYGRKHLENTLTAFIQLRWYPEMHMTDKRKWHYSSMIASGQMTRDEAIEKMKEPIATQEEKDAITKVTAEKLNTTVKEIESMLKSTPHSYSEYRCSYYYRNYTFVIGVLSKIKHRIFML